MTAHADAGVRPVAGVARHVLAILALPFLNTVVIPTAIIVFGGSVAEVWDSMAAGGAQQLPRLLFGAAFICCGLALVVTSIRLFATRGKGTLAPWDPPRNLVISGPYRFVRNPMKSGLIFVLIGVSIILQSVALSVWCAAFAIVNVLYISFSEEPGLRRRFGADYERYCASVPAWLPRLTPWFPCP